MLDLAKLAATPLVIRVGDKEYRLAPLTLGQLGEIEAWARKTIRDEACENLPQKVKAIYKCKLPEAMKEGLAKQAFLDLERPSYDPVEITRLMDSIAGQRKAFELAAKACQEITDKELDEICSLAGMAQVRAWVEAALSGGEDKKPNPPAAQANPKPDA